MALHWKLVIDCHDPHGLADFWADALGYEVEDPGALVEQLLAANRVELVDQGPAGRWWVMRDPERNEFCAAG